MAQLIIGPLLRYVSDSEATIFVETDAACEVEILDAKAPTFHVEGHHYALVQLTGLEPGTKAPYEVRLDGQLRWPEADSPYPPSVIRTHGEGEPVEIVFGSCRVALPHEPPHTLPKDVDERGREFDALWVLAREMLKGEVEGWPDVLLMLGDQVYADEGSPQARAFIRSRRDASKPPGEEVADFEEYTRLYWESWGDPLIRWLLSTVSSSMIFDDHDMHDDWNISRWWLEDMRKLDWWQKRIVAGYMSYWIYQHIGNLSPRHLERNEAFQRVTGAEDGGPLLREYAERWDREETGTTWSYCRDIGKTRLIVMDSRGGRVLRDERRSIFDDDEWSWIEEHATGDFDHLLIGTSDPFLLAPGMHYLEAWNEATCDGAWGYPFAYWVAERIRRALDFDHWGSFALSFARLTHLIRDVGSGNKGHPPESILVLSGDVHHAYLADVAYPSQTGVESAVWQAVVSPMRNALDKGERRGIAKTRTWWGLAIARALARLAGVREPDLRWRFVEGPFYDNQVGTLFLDGRSARMKLEKTNPADQQDERRLEVIFERVLTPRTAPSSDRGVPPSRSFARLSAN
jgi:hypothetical protein